MKYANFEDFLGSKHWEENPHLLDDDLSDAFDNWVSELNADDWLRYADNYADERAVEAEIRGLREARYTLEAIHNHLETLHNELSKDIGYLDTAYKKVKADIEKLREQTKK